MASTINAKNTSTGVVITPDSSGQLELQTADTTRMTIDVNGNVGVGTSTPNANSGTALVLYSTNTPRFRLTNSTTGQTAGDGSEISLFSTGELIIENRENASTIFYNNGAERMRIDTSGNLLVGTSTAVQGTAGTLGIQLDSLGAIYTGKNSTLARTHLGFSNPNGQVGSISTSGTTTSFNTSSDYRLKENIAPMTGALDTVALLKPVTYTWKVDGSDGQGFIAHELQEVVPECVSGEKDAVDKDGNPEYQGVDTSFLVATLTAAIQEQQAIINDLKARVEVLENK